MPAAIVDNSRKFIIKFFIYPIDGKTADDTVELTTIFENIYNRRWG